MFVGVAGFFSELLVGTGGIDSHQAWQLRIVRGAHSQAGNSLKY